MTRKFTELLLKLTSSVREQIQTQTPGRTSYSTISSSATLISQLSSFLSNAWQRSYASSTRFSVSSLSSNPRILKEQSMEPARYSPDSLQPSFHPFMQSTDSSVNQLDNRLRKRVKNLDCWSISYGLSVAVSLQLFSNNSNIFKCIKPANIQCRKWYKCKSLYGIA